jgi:thiol-disulfide isomerase/thioredoxin
MTLAILAALTLGVTQQRLSIGDPAPALGFGAEIKGSPVRAFSRSKVTVVEFWATWCQPCITFMPHLSDLWAKYKDRADFVSVSVMENDYSKVKPFVESMGDKMAYPVAIDKVDSKSKGFMLTHWLQAAGQNSIPVAFIVDRDAKIAWIGQPQGMEKVLARVIDGSWDAKAYRIKLQARLKDEEASAHLMRDGFSIIASTVRTRSYAATLTWIARNRHKYDGPEAQGALDVFKQLFSAFSKRDYAAVLKQTEAEQTNGLVWTYYRPMLLVARIDAMQNLNMREWRDVALEAINKSSDPNILMGLTDALTLAESKLQKAPDVALLAAEKLTALARDPLFLLRLAWAHHANGQTDKAMATIEEAMQKMPEEKKRRPQTYDGLMKRLKEARVYFDKGKPGQRSSILDTIYSETYGPSDVSARRRS